MGLGISRKSKLLMRAPFCLALSTAWLPAAGDSGRINSCRYNSNSAGLEAHHSGSDVIEIAFNPLKAVSSLTGSWAPTLPSPRPGVSTDRDLHITGLWAGLFQRRVEFCVLYTTAHQTGLELFQRHTSREPELDPRSHPRPLAAIQAKPRCHLGTSISYPGLHPGTRPGTRPGTSIGYPGLHRGLHPLPPLRSWASPGGVPSGFLLADIVVH